MPDVLAKPLHAAGRPASNGIPSHQMLYYNIRDAGPVSTTARPRDEISCGQCNSATPAPSPSEENTNARMQFAMRNAIDRPQNFATLPRLNDTDLGTRPGM